MTALVKYEAARAALQAAHKIDEVKDIRDKSQAMAAYAKQAQDTQLVAWASEIKVRAERRAGEMLTAMPKANGSRGHGKKVESLEVTPLLADLGISKNQSSSWQKVAAVPEEKFEKAIAEAKDGAGIVTTAAVLRTAKPKKGLEPKPEKKEKPAADPKAQAALTELQSKYADQTERLGEMADLAASAKAFEEKTEFKEMQILRVELRGAKRRRDELMRENAELKKQVAHWRKKAGKK